MVKKMNFKMILLIIFIGIIIYAIIDRICTAFEVRKFTDHLDEIIQLGPIDKVGDDNDK